MKLVASSEHVFQTKSASDESTSSVAVQSRALHSLRHLLVRVLTHESRASASHSKQKRRKHDDDSPELLSSALLKECVHHFKQQSQKHDRRGSASAANRFMAESLHPHYHTSDYKGEVHVPGAKSIRVTFDHRW